MPYASLTLTYEAVSVVYHKCRTHIHTHTYIHTHIHTPIHIHTHLSPMGLYLWYTTNAENNEGSEGQQAHCYRHLTYIHIYIY
jgi:hypothetical protein